MNKNITNYKAKCNQNIYLGQHPDLEPDPDPDFRPEPDLDMEF
jgi:hypothetical protein